MLFPSNFLLTVAICITLVTASSGTSPADHTLIYVSLSESGIHDTSCWTAGSAKPCSSLDLALEGVHNLSASGTTPRAWIMLVSTGSYPLASNKHTNFVGPQIKDFGLVANLSATGGDMPVIQCGHSVGFSFTNVSLVTIENVTFNECSSPQPSTSRKKSNETLFWEFMIGLNFIHCSDISFDNVWVMNTTGIGTFLFSSYGTNRFQKSRFYGNNALKNDTYPAGGGLYVEYSTCLPSSPTLCTELTEYKPSTLAINGCIFEGNSGEVPDNVNVEDVWEIPTGSAHSSIGRGGGLSVTFEGESNNIEVTVSNTMFNNNKAYWGGGLFVEFHDNASNNSLKVNHSQFNDNSVNASKIYGTGGGGVRMAIMFLRPSHAFNNSITFDVCNFTENKAKWGGGVSFYTAREHDVLDPSNKLTFLKCSWLRNRAWLGAAVDLDVWHANYIGLPVVVDFYHATVKYNHALRADWKLLGVAVIYTDSVPIRFSGFSTFSYNNGSVLVASSSSISFEGALFDNNYGRNGGAIQLAGNAFLMIGPNTTLFFYNNTAEQKGGAIFVETLSKHDLITQSPNCFIHYADVTLPPKDWRSRVTFIRNTANGKNNSIYMTTTNPCEWHDSPNATKGSNGSALCWNHWSYYKDLSESGQDNCSQQIETDPMDFTAKTFIKKKLFVTPGVQMTLPEEYNVVDDFGNEATERLVLTASIRTAINYTDNKTTTSDAFIQPFITNNTFTMHGKTNKSYFVELYTMGPRVVYTSAQVELLPCPFGFLNNVTQNKDFSCVCDRVKASFNGIVECSQMNLSSNLNLLGQWAGYNRLTGHRVAGYSPYTANLTKTQLSLPPVNETSDPGDYFCEPMNRMDVLCGKCANNTGPSINSENYKCVKCDPGVENYSWLFYIGSEILPLTVFFLLLMLFNVSLTSGTANAFVFFSQIVTTTFGIYTASSGPYLSFREAYRFVYGIWNLDIFSALPFFQYCLSPNLDTLTVILLEYVIAFYPLLVIFVLYSLIAMYNRGVRPITWLCTPLRHCFIRLRNSWNPNSSLLDAIAAFILLSYSRMVQTSLKLLRYSTLYHENGSPENTVVYYDGTILAYEGKHLLYVVIALLVLIVFVAIPPLVLILYPLKVVHRLTSPVCSLSGGRFEQFLNAFYGSYKDGAKEGTRDYRFFAGLYLVYRVLFPIIRFLPHWQMIYLVQNVFCLVAILLFTTLRPYRNDMHNKFDVCIFSILLLVSLLNQFNFNLVYLETDESVSPWIFALEYVLIWTPFAIVTCLLLYWLCKKYVNRVKRKVERSKTLEATLTHADIQPTASNVFDDNSIIQLMDERPNMYNYGSVNISPIPSSDNEDDSGRRSNTRSHSNKGARPSSRSHSSKEWSRPLLSSIDDS